MTDPIELPCKSCEYGVQLDYLCCNHKKAKTIGKAKNAGKISRDWRPRIITMLRCPVGKWDRDKWGRYVLNQEAGND